MAGWGGEEAYPLLPCSDCGSGRDPPRSRTGQVLPAPTRVGSGKTRRGGSILPSLVGVHSLTIGNWLMSSENLLCSGSLAVCGERLQFTV
ncbi:unnamed protein product [Linum trigynum]|uniref:Uncharacterized protein n=1 Tax=Linum trigynum TaxID=586398 RepID=A0AAV2EWP4_9ROSI